jgi:hypothetical protein
LEWCPRASKVLHLESKLFWNGVKDDGGRWAIMHDILHKLHHIDVDVEYFIGYQI